MVIASHTGVWWLSVSTYDARVRVCKSICLSLSVCVLWCTVNVNEIGVCVSVFEVGTQK